MDINITDYTKLCLIYPKNKLFYEKKINKLALLPISIKLWLGILINIIINFPLICSKSNFSSRKNKRDISLYSLYNSILMIIYRFSKNLETKSIYKDMIFNQFAFIFIKVIIQKYNISDSIVINCVLLFINAY